MREGVEGPALDWVWASRMGPLGASVTGAAAQQQVDIMHTMMAGTYAAADGSTRGYGFSGLLFHRGPSVAMGAEEAVGDREEEAGHYWAVRPAGDGTFFEVDSLGSRVVHMAADDVNTAVMTALGGERATVMVVGTPPPTTTQEDLQVHVQARRRLTDARKRKVVGAAAEAAEAAELPPAKRQCPAECGVGRDG